MPMHARLGYQNLIEGVRRKRVTRMHRPFRFGVVAAYTQSQADWIKTARRVKQLFTQETVNFRGKYYAITEMKGYPRPVQKPHPPLLIAGTGERMLRLAAREADIIAVGSKITARGVDQTDASLEQKVAWIKEAAGERFSQLELCQTVFDLMI